MFLKSLILKGFKSFADKTHMRFCPGMTVVVGPNGSGKSNISDAILWVLGEQSAKMLRGQAMEDVIFSGSSARKPVGIAEVTLILDNSDHTLPIEFTEVGLTRRMYRSGESEYLINGSPARLMDIQDILHDSGLGKDTHSIISQGKLDSILASRPEERRALIEEAASISKHRRRKERSEKKLASMDANVVRARDVFKEITRQLRPLERQVDKAKQYNDRVERLSEISCMLAVDDLRQLQEEWQSLEKNTKEAHAEMELARYRYNEKVGELEKLQSMFEQKGLFVGDLGEQRRRCQDMLGRVDSDMRLLEEKGRNMVARLSEMRAALSAIDKQRADAIVERDRVSGELSDVRVTYAELTKRHDEAEPEASAAKEAYTSAEKHVAQLADDLRTQQRLADEATLAHARLTEKLSHVEVKREMYNSRLAQIADTTATARTACDERKAAVSDLEKRLGAALAASEKVNANIQSLTRERDTLREAADAARVALSQGRAQLEALVSVEQAVESSSPLIASLMSGVAGERVTCRLGDLFEVPEHLEAVVEALLGEDVNALVVSSDADLAALASAASSVDTSGAATLVAVKPTVDMPSREAARLLINEMTISSDAVPLVSALFGDVVLVDSIAEALTAHATDPSYVYAASDGSYVLRDGRVRIGCSADRLAGSLERKRHIRSLKKSLPVCEQKLKEAESMLSKAESSLATAHTESDKHAGEISEIRGELGSVRSEVARLEAQISSAEAEHTQVRQRCDEVCAEADRFRPELVDLAEKVNVTTERADELKKKLEEAERVRAAAQNADAATAENMAEIRLALATTRERQTHLAKRFDELTARVTSFDERRTAHLAGSESLEVLRLRIDPLHERYEALREAVLMWASRLRDRANLAEADSESLKKTIADAKAEVARAAKQLEEAQLLVSDHRVASGKLEVQVQTALDRIAQEGNRSVEEALQLPQLDNREALEREVVSLERAIKGLGPINQVAVDEYRRLKERADYIEEQLSDLETARACLTKIMAAIDRKMRKQFLTTFDEVNVHFGHMFSLLFPGGSARLEMLDPDHPSETGIEVVAQPCGKRITKMSLMSGGEKALVALALLFAVYRTRTVPFYVFDEVEAALDDANLNRLLGAIEQLKKQTQLIVISHQRRTMEQADVLYGVSMRADGVSAVISQRLNELPRKAVRH